MNYWLIKSEGDCYSIDDLARDTKKNKDPKNPGVPWTGVRNFQARNFMRDGMKKGDLALFYHSSSKPNGVYGIAKVVSAPHIDETALDPKDEHYDAKAVKYANEGKEPMWMCVDVAFVRKLAEPFSLEEIKFDSELKNMLVAQVGQRLSVMPVSEKHFHKIAGKK